MLKFISLGSGSSGNCYYLQTDNDAMLIDAGVGIRSVKNHLHKCGLSLSNVKRILVTHDHADHIRYAYTIVRRYRHIRIYSTPRLMNGLLRRHNVSRRIKDYQENIYKEININKKKAQISIFNQIILFFNFLNILNLLNFLTTFIRFSIFILKNLKINPYRRFLREYVKKLGRLRKLRC